jgi:hypothetical protein
MSSVNAAQPSNAAAPVQQTPPPAPPPPEPVAVKVAPQDSQETVLNRAYAAMADKAGLNASAKEAFVRHFDQADNYSNHLRSNGKDLSAADFAAIKQAGNVVVYPTAAHAQMLGSLKAQDQPTPIANPVTPMGSGAASVAKEEPSFMSDPEAWLGNKIDSGVKSAEAGVDGFRKDLVSFGKEHGGFVGESLARNVSDKIGFVEGGALALYDMGSGVVKIASGAGHLLNPVDWITKPEENLGRLEAVGNTVGTLAKLGSPIGWAMDPEGNAKAAGQLWDGVTKGYQDAAKDGDYSKFAGRLVVDVGSFFIGAGEANAAVKGAQGAATAGRIGETARVIDGVGDAGRVINAGDKVGDAGRVAAGAEDAGKAGKGADAAADGARIAGVETKAAAMIDKLAPQLKADIQALEKADWTIQAGEAGKGSYAIREDKIIVIDASEKGAEAISVIAHEVGHAKYSPAFDYSSRQAYLKTTLADEGEAVLRNIEARDEILKAGGEDIGIRGTQGAEYQKVYDQYLIDGNRGAARDKIADIFGSKEKTSTTGQSYNDYYGGHYDKNIKPTLKPSPEIPGRVDSAGGRVGESSTFKTNADVPTKYTDDARFNDLATDPAHAGANAISAKTRVEAMAGLEAEAKGIVQGPIKRGPAEIEFFDVHGNPWDVKTPITPEAGARWPFKVDEVGASIKRELTEAGNNTGPGGTHPNALTGEAADRKIILNTTFMSEADHASLTQWMNANLTPEQLGRIFEVNITK